MKWLTTRDANKVIALFPFIAEMGRWDDFYVFINTKVEDAAFEFLYKQLAEDVESDTPSLLAKWLKSENTSSLDSRRLAKITRNHFNMTSKQYRKTLSYLRAKLNVLEVIMSANRWDEIDFSKIPSIAGMNYRNCFARRDELKERYAKFMESEETEVNAEALYPADIVNAARDYLKNCNDDTLRAVINKYWANLKNYFENNATLDAVVVCDTSGSMLYGNGKILPIDVAISLAMYCAMKCGKDSPFYNHYISFSREAKLIEIAGYDFVDKVRRIYSANLCENTNIESVFNLLLSTAITNELSSADMPKNVIIVSDMEFDKAVGDWWYDDEDGVIEKYQSVIEQIKTKWEDMGFDFPNLIFWNVNARSNQIPMKQNGHISFVSGYSPSIMDAILTGKTGVDLMFEKLNNKRYADIHW